MKKMPIGYAITGRSRSVDIPGIMNMSVEPVPTIHPIGEVWGALGTSGCPGPTCVRGRQAGKHFR